MLAVLVEVVVFVFVVVLVAKETSFINEGIQAVATKEGRGSAGLLPLRQWLSYGIEQFLVNS